MRTFSHTCLCGRRIPPNQRCPICERLPTEAERLALNPKRASYRNPAYHRNRWVRYNLVGGVCECGCGTRLRGPLHPDGQPWECHHVPADSAAYDARYGRDDPPNLRAMYRGHHNRYTR